MDTKMQAAVLHAPGDLRVENVSLPSDISSREVLVKVFAAGICGSDAERVMKTGTYSFPMVPGHEFCGMVETIGSAVNHLQEGDKVVVAPLMPCFNCEPCQRGLYGLCADYNFLGSRIDGGFAQFVKAPAMNVLKMPASIEYVEGAAIEPAAVTLHGIRQLNIIAGDTAAVVGCGALGFFAIQFARLAGAATVIAIDIDEEKLGLSHEVGADYCIDASTQDVIGEVKKLTANKGVDIAIETAGINMTREQCLEIVKKKGQVILYGTAHGDVIFSPAAFEKVIRYELVIRGSWNSYSVPFPGQEWLTIIDYLRDQKLMVKPLISHVFQLSEAPRVFKDVFDRKLKFNKIVFTPNG